VSWILKRDARRSRTEKRKEEWQNRLLIWKCVLLELLLCKHEVTFGKIHFVLAVQNLQVYVVFYIEDENVETVHHQN
jgi:hypothetical protein